MHSVRTVFRLWERLHESNLNRPICEQWWADVA